MIMIIIALKNHFFNSKYKSIIYLKQLQLHFIYIQCLEYY